MLGRALRNRELVPVESSDRERRPAVGDGQHSYEKLVVAREKGAVGEQALEGRHVRRFLRVSPLARLAGEVLHELEASLPVLGALGDDD